MYELNAKEELQTFHRSLSFRFSQSPAVNNEQILSNREYFIEQ